MRLRGGFFLWVALKVALKTLKVTEPFRVTWIFPFAFFNHGLCYSCSRVQCFHHQKCSGLRSKRRELKRLCQSPEVLRGGYGDAKSITVTSTVFSGEDTENEPVSTEQSPQYKIRRAHLTLVISDIERAAEEIRQKAEQLQGYVSSLEFYDLTQERRAGHITLRVPGDQFETALAMLGEVGKVRDTSFSEEDVTLQYVDLEARIKTMEAQEKRLRELLEKADKVEEVLEVEKELWRVRGDLESMVAEFRHLQQQVSYSTINIHLQEKDPLTTSLVEDLGTWEKIGSFFALNTNRLIKGVSGFVVFIIGSLPILIPLALLVFISRAIALAVKGRKNQNSLSQRERKMKQKDSFLYRFAGNCVPPVGFQSSSSC